jgi:hypothetical protein
MNLPIAWEILTRYLRVPPELSTTTWKAMTRSHWSRPTGLRRTIQLFGSIRMDSNKFLENSCAPSELMAAIEDLVTEQRLSRRKGSVRMISRNWSMFGMRAKTGHSDYRPGK